MANITPLTGRTRVPTRIIFFDTETVDIPIDPTTDLMELKLGFAIYARWYGDRLKVVSDIRFREAKEFWNFVVKISETQPSLYIVAHNILFDMSVVNGFEELPKLGYQLNSWYDKGLTSIYRWQLNTSKIVMIDSTNFFSMKLEKLGEKMGFEKLKIDFDTATDSELETYNIRDVEILKTSFENLYNFWFTHDFGKLGVTVGSSAMQAFRKKYLRRTIITSRTDYLRMQERLSYHGGRVYVGFQGKRNSEIYYKLDYNSLYPSVMIDERMPTKYSFTMYGPTNSRAKTYLSQYCAIAYCSLNTNVNPFCVFDGERNIYPIGEFSTWLTTPEILFALEHSLLTKIHIIHLYDAHNIFHDFINQLYKIRMQYKKDGNTPFDLLAKDLMNNVYGKFAQYSIKQIQTGHELIGVVDRTRTYSTVSKKYEMEYAFAGKRWINIQDGDAKLSFTAISSHVTALGRLKWWEAFNVAGRPNVFYGDTDSYIVTEQGLNLLDKRLDTTLLGALKIEDTANEIEIFCPKDYTFGEKIVRKGIPDKAEEIERSVFRMERFVRWKESIIKYNTIKPYRTIIIKKLDRQVYDGDVNPSGWVEPKELHQLPQFAYHPLPKE